MAQTRKLFESTIKSLMRSQGFYGRIWESYSSMDEDGKNEVLKHFVGCKDTLDVVMVLEC